LTACATACNAGRQACLQRRPPGLQTQTPGVSQNRWGPAGQAVNGLAEEVPGAESALSLL